MGWKCYNPLKWDSLSKYVSRNKGMKGFDGRGWFRNASREAPTSLTQRKKSSANRTSYAAMPLAA